MTHPVHRSLPLHMGVALACGALMPATFAFMPGQLLPVPRFQAASSFVSCGFPTALDASGGYDAIPAKRRPTKKRRRKDLPESELVRRRKSPALWRYDLSNAQEAGNAPTAGDLPDAENDSAPEWWPPTPPEIMAPAGGLPQLRAAIANGADSVYVGCSAFSARARASNFDAEHELPEAVRLAHAAGVRVFVALNTLVFDHELSEVEDLIRKIDAAGTDALIVQDLGVCKVARRVAPGLELHASTQQSVTSSDGVRHAAGLGASRVVLGRELSTKEMEAVARDIRTDAKLQGRESEGEGDSTSASGTDPDPVEIEAFVHGALCVSYSGQCFSSEAWGGRSANRGQCAQACRLPYGLVTDGVLTNLGDVDYLLSPQDLCGLEQVPALIRAGVACLKIEGRLKDSAYVAATTRAYRNAVDEAWNDLLRERHDRGIIDDDERDRQLSFSRRRSLSIEETVSKKELTQLFSRGQDEDNDGLTPGFFEGAVHQRLVRGRSPRHRGLHMGRVGVGSSPREGIVVTSLDVDTLRSLKRGDGVVIDRGDAQAEELGGPLFDVGEVQRDGQTSSSWSVPIRFSRDIMGKWAKQRHLVPEGGHVWRTADALVDKKMRRLVEAPPPRAEAEVRVSGSIGEPLVVTIALPDGRVGTGSTEGPLEAADGGGLPPTKISKAVGTLGDTEFAIGAGGVDTSLLEDGIWCPISWVKAARRAAVADLEDQNASFETGCKRIEVAVEKGVVDDFLRENLSHPASAAVTTRTRISILARTYEQVDRICELAQEGQDIDEVIIDFLEVDGMRDAVARVHEVQGMKAVVASPRIIKPGECGIWRTLLRLEPDALLIRSAGLLHRMSALGGEGAKVNVASASRMEKDCFVTIPPLIGDFALNAANAITAGELLSSGLNRITAAFDLSASAITELAELCGRPIAARMDVIAHTHLPIFHTEHCVFARFLTQGDSYVDCGHACTRHSVHLRDQSGADNLVLADMGCRNTVFASEAQSGVHSLMEWRDVGIGRVRVELVDENTDDTERILRGYLGVLSGDIRPRDVWEELKDVRDSNGRAGGVSHGSLRNNVERRAGEL